MKELSQDLIFEIIKENAFSLDKNKKNYGMITHFFEDNPNIDFEKIQNDAEKLGFFVKRACDIKSNDPEYKKLWEEKNAIIIFWSHENIL